MIQKPKQQVFDLLFLFTRLGEERSFTPLIEEYRSETNPSHCHKAGHRKPQCMVLPAREQKEDYEETASRHEHTVPHIFTFGGTNKNAIE